MLKKKLFALASVTALAGLVGSATAAGCSSSSDPNGNGAGEGGLTDAREAKAPFDAAEPPEDTGPPTCPTADKIDAKTFAWKPPAVMQGACTDAQIKALAKVVDDNAKVSYKDLKASVTDVTCNKCLFGPDGPKWAALVEDAKGEFLRHNFGGCVAVLSGSDDCGKAYSQYDDCINAACDACADQAAFDKCSTPASKGACKQAVTDVQTVCGDGIDAIGKCQDLSTKYLFESAARALCVDLGLDGGVDGGADSGDSGL